MVGCMLYNHKGQAMHYYNKLEIATTNSPKSEHGAIIAEPNGHRWT